jgi:hypothetical protein
MARIIFDNNRPDEKELDKHEPVGYACYIDQRKNYFKTSKPY